MNQQTPKQNIRKSNPFMVGDNVLETVRSIGGNVGRTMQDESKKIPEGMIRDIFAAGGQQEELKQNETVDLQSEPIISKVQQPREVIRELRTIDQQKTQQELIATRQQIETIAKQTGNTQLKQAMIEQPTENPGVYHTNFFEQLLDTAKQLAKPDDGLTIFNNAGTKRKRLGFWKQYKSKGTTFGLNNERTVATQAG